jgi:sodium-coupled monocarboxylate transporter 8/12
MVLNIISFFYRALYWNLLGLIFILGISLAVGLVIYTKYSLCDPLTAGRIEISEQVCFYTVVIIKFFLSKMNFKLFPLFVMETLNTTTGLPGLFLACLFSAALR